MARWDPDAESRLRHAALELFTQHGYDAVTAAQIAEAAGLTRRTFFRHFPDKKEVLFAGADTLPAKLVDRLAQANSELAPIDVVLNMLAEAGTFILRDREYQHRRRAIIASSTELQERERTKLAAISDVVARYLVSRRFEIGYANLLGTVSVAIFHSSYEQSLNDPGGEDFRAVLDSACSGLSIFEKQ